MYGSDRHVLKLIFTFKRYIFTLETMFIKEEKKNSECNKKKAMAMELIASIQPLMFFQLEIESPLCVQTILRFAQPGSAVWQKIAVS